MPEINPHDVLSRLQSLSASQGDIRIARAIAWVEAQIAVAADDDDDKACAA